MDPYTPPADVIPILNLPELLRKKKFWGRAMWISFSVIAIPPFWGLISIIVTMKRAFASSGTEGVGDPKALGSAIGEIVIASAAGLIFTLPIILFFILSLIRFFSYRSKIRQISG